MNQHRAHWKRGLLTLAVALACNGCGTDQGLRVTAAADAGTGGAAPAARPSAAPSTTQAAPPSGGLAGGRGPLLNAGAAAKNLAVNMSPGIRPDVQCKTPEESYDFTGVIGARYGNEGALRMKKLLDSDLKDSSLSAQDRKMLNTLAREMLWIPAPVEERIGSLMFSLGSRDMQMLPRDANGEIWDGSGQLIARLLAAAPKTPFETRLYIVEKGEPGSLAGGLVLLDSRSVTTVFDNQKDTLALTRLNFVLAHELAHIYKRHRAKRIQQLMVDSDAGMKMTRLIFRNVSKGGVDLGATAMVQMTLLMPELIDLVRKNNARYEQDQEFEADGCATSLMLSAGIGDPLAGFRAYRQDQREQNKLAGETKHWDPYVSHPPNDAREKNIQTRMNAIMAQAVKEQGPLRVETGAGPANRKPAGAAARPPAGAANAASAPTGKKP